jgi:sulfite reductase (NADPH) flavoprotein alpha-component
MSIMNNALKQIDPPQGDSLDQAQRQNLAQAIQGLNRQQLNWASGYLAGLSQAQIPEQASQELEQITILYASQTGNAQSIARQLETEYQASGINTRLISSADYRGRDLAKEKYLLLVISTQGEGETPESAFELQQFLFGPKAPQLKQLNYAVFGLGDSSYPDFCQAGKDFDQRLEDLGAQRLLDRVDADVDFDESASEWRATVIQQSHDWLSVSTDNVVNLNAASQSIRYDRNNPYLATVLDSKRITTQDAIAEIHHIELQIDATSLQYQPGDSIGLWSRNNPALVQQILQQLQLDADTLIEYKKQQLTLQQSLEEQLEITHLHPSVIKTWATITDNDELKQLMEDKDQLRSFATSYQLIDLVLQYPATVDAQTLVQTLLPLQPRLYSIASSQQAFDDEIHLTVSTLRYETQSGDTRYGSASQFLNQHIQSGDSLRIYVAENNQFRLPENNQTPIIMIGAGTGIAPFRAFLQQRKAENASGENWLIFGNRNFHCDFLYQLEWQKYRAEGLLNRISLAFSRDYQSKVYVQDRLFEEAEELYRWIDKGAQLYVCGSTNLDTAVHQALVNIVQQHDQLDTQQAEQFVNNLRAEGRYLRDVY